MPFAEWTYASPKIKILKKSFFREGLEFMQLTSSFREEGGSPKKIDGLVFRLFIWLSDIHETILHKLIRLGSKIEFTIEDKF